MDLYLRSGEGVILWDWLCGVCSWVVSIVHEYLTALCEHVILSI